MSVTKADLNNLADRIETRIDKSDAKNDARFLTLTALIGQLAQTVADNETRRQRDMKEFGGIISDLASHMDRRFDELTPRVDNHERRITVLERRPAS